MIDAPISHTNIQVGHCTRLPFICHRAGVIRSPGAGRGLGSCHTEGDASRESEFPLENVLTATELSMQNWNKSQIVVACFKTVYCGRCGSLLMMILIADFGWTCTEISQGKFFKGPGLLLLTKIKT